MPVRGKRLLAGEIVVLVGTLVAAVASSEAADWEPAGLVLVLLGLAVVSDLLALQHKTQRISGAFFAIVLALALCGPAPAVLIGAVCVLVDAVRTRPALHKLLTNVTAYTTIPLLVGLAFQGAREVTSIETENFTFAIAVFGAFVLCNVLNFALIAVAMSVYLGIPLGREIRTVYVPVRPVRAGERACSPRASRCCTARPGSPRSRCSRSSCSSSSSCCASCCARSGGPRSSPRCSSGCSRAWSTRSRCATA